MSFSTKFACQQLDLVNGQFTACPPLSHVQAATLSASNVDDTLGLIYSSLITFADSLSGLRQGYYSWATCKLYYCMYYSLRASLLLRNYAIFYYNGKPGLIEIKPGGAIRKLTKGEASGGSHGSTLSLFKRLVPNSILINTIDGNDSLQWLKGMREQVNYNIQRFSEPDCPQWFEQSIGKYPARKLLSGYIDDLLLYSFDKDHAVIALPLLALKKVIDEGLLDSMELSVVDKTYISQRLKDDAGPISALNSYLGLL